MARAANYDASVAVDTGGTFTDCVWIEQGRIRLKERVTVRFVTGDDGDTAILVIVRPTSTQQKKK